ncbi:5-amino-6-(5-phospho-D-ribitylamino)uracil phosphatase, chloroplastic-like isoform X4 [Primulina huaijiensis]|uniref:5-amino-6-(5-phospho-D-ribitylamino)uracil phosphatase, chloroplastic-like isoform X4 n=1 Tax=Primulina huaijiensis TaxID=1492673 RepID=UPI003CC73F92
MENTLSFARSPLPPLSPTLFQPRLPATLRLLRLNRSNSEHGNSNMFARNVFGPNENGSLNGFSSLPKKNFMEEVIGAEYGEGFETFRPEGPLKVDVANTRALKLDAWEKLASEEGKEIPRDDSVQRVLHYAGADHVLRKVWESLVLLWGMAEADLDRLKLRLSELYCHKLVELSEPIEGLKEWLDAIATSRIPCAVVSSLDRKNMVEALERMGLKKFFQAIVSEEDGMDSIAHRFLSAAVKLDRKPSKCVVFEDDPRGITAAHNCTMMAVALIGAHPAYDLGQADLAVASFNELSVINLRRLFAHIGSTFMDLQKQVIDKAPSKRKLHIDTIF